MLMARTWTKEISRLRACFTTSFANSCVQSPQLRQYCNYSKPLFFRATNSGVDALHQDATGVDTLVKEYQTGTIDTKRFLRGLIEWDRWVAIPAGPPNDQGHIKVVSLTNMQGEDESVFWTSEQRLVCFEPELRKILDLPRRARLPRVLLPGFVAFHEIDRTGKAGSCPARVQIDAGNSANFAIEREFLPIVSEWAAYVTLEKGLEFHLTTQISSQPQSVHPTLKDLLNREIFLLTEGAEHFTVPAGVFRNSLTSAKQEDHINRYGRSNRAVAFTAPDLLTNFEAVLEAHNVSKDYDVHKLPLMRAIEELFGRGDLDCPSIIINPCDGKRELALPGHVGLQWLKDA